MTTPRKRLVEQISNILGNRDLLWYGTRGDDARALTDLEQFKGSFTILNKYKRHSLSYSVAYEEIAGNRVDLDDWDIDNHLFDDDTSTFRNSIFTAMTANNAIIPYRPSLFLSALVFARKDRTLNLGLFAPHQRVFEYKPMVELAVASLGIPTLEWKYIADQNQLDAEKLLADGPIVVRPSRGSGGSGMTKVESPNQLASLWPKQEEFFASVSRYYNNCLPINVGAVVWENTVTVHFPSIQLVGIASCVKRPFGYCGNDFALAATLDRQVIDGIEEATIKIGGWLRSQGYLGGFGVDYLLDGDTLRFTEVNPRFQGSTRLSSFISVERDEPCILLDHIAAFLHLEPGQRLSLFDRIKESKRYSHVVLHNTQDQAALADCRSLLEIVGNTVQEYRADVLADSTIPCSPDSVIASITVERGVTSDGYSLHDDLAEVFVANRYIDKTLGG